MLGHAAADALSICLANPHVAALHRPSTWLRLSGSSRAVRQAAHAAAYNSNAAQHRASHCSTRCAAFSGSLWHGAETVLAATLAHPQHAAADRGGGAAAARAEPESSSAAAVSVLDRGIDPDSGAESDGATAVCWQRETEACIGDALREDNLPAARHAYQQLVAGGGFPADATCEQLLKALARSGAFQATWELYLAALRQGTQLRYKSYLAVMTAGLKAGKPGNALRAFEDIQAAGMQPNVVTYCGLISGLARSRHPGFLRSARRLWGELRASGQHLDAAAFRTGINVCVEVGDLEGAQRVTAAMRAAGHLPDARVYNILIKGYARAGLLSLLPDLVADMQLEGLKLNGVSYATLVEAHVSAGHLDLASQWVAAARIAGVQLDAWAYTALLKGRIKARDAKGAREVLAEMRAAGAPPNAVTYTILLDAQVASGDLKAAREVLQQMRAEGQQPTPVTFNALLRGYAAKGRAGRSGSAWVLQQMRRAGLSPNTSTYNTLMSGYAAAGDPANAINLWHQMRGAQLRPDTCSYTILINAYSQLRQHSEAVAAFRALEADRRTPVDEPALCAFIAALARSGREGAAAALLPRANAMAAAAGRQPPIAAHGALVDAHCRRGRLDAALAAVQAFVDAGGSPDLRIYDRLVDSAMRAHDFRRALQVVRAMEARGFELDRARYKALFAEVCRREEAERCAGRSGNGAGVGEEAAPNENLERFKWWLGMPSTYYRQQAD